MIKWKELAYEALADIEKNTKIEKRIIQRVYSIIAVLCHHCRILYPNYNICCCDKCLEVYPLKDGRGIELYHRFNTTPISEASFIIEVNKDGKICCTSNIFCGIEQVCVYSKNYTGNNIAQFIESVFDEWYHNDCDNIEIISIKN